MSDHTPGEIRSVLVTDCGSTTSKAALFEKRDGGFRLVARGEAPSTVEAPQDDVTLGVLEAVGRCGQACGRELADRGNIVRPQQNGRGVDAYLCTSSAGGRLHVIAAGVVGSMSTASAVRAVADAGGVVIDAFSSDDGRPAADKIELLRHRHPDLVVLAGGSDGGASKPVLGLAEMIASAGARPHFGEPAELAVLFAGNRDCRDDVAGMFGQGTAVHAVDNLRPTTEREDLQATREATYAAFLRHAMADAPGFAKLIEWVDAPLLPSAAAVEGMLKQLAERQQASLLGVDLGGSVTTVFSAQGGERHQTAHADLGLSYAIADLAAAASWSNVARWLPMPMDMRALANRIGNKMIRPTTLPEQLDELVVEQALAREALRLAVARHRATRQRFSLQQMDIIIGTGGALVHAPRPNQAFAILNDAVQPQGITELRLDGLGIMSHLGALSTLNATAAAQVWDKDGLLRLGTCIAPVCRGALRPGRPALLVDIHTEAGTVSRMFNDGDYHVFKAEEAWVDIELKPARGYDVGAGPGNATTRKVAPGSVGVAIDCRGRPLSLPEGSVERMALLSRWKRAVEEYPFAENDEVA